MGKEDNKPNPNPNPNPEGGKEGKEGKPDNSEKFKKMKDEYENQLSNKDKEIEKLKQELADKQKEVDETLKNLDDEVVDKLKTSEEYKELLKTVEELQKERAEAAVDAYIQKGVILPVQRETAVKLCLSDNDTFMDLYKDAKPIVDVGKPKSKPVPSDLMGRISNYLK